MVQVNLKELVGKLNDTCRSTLEAAAGLCLSRTNYNVEIEHWLIKLVEAGDSDVAAILRHFEVDSARLTADLTKVLDRIKTGNSRSPALAPNVVKIIREAWVFASLQYSASAIRGGHLLVALLSDDSLAAVARDASPLLGKEPHPPDRPSPARVHGDAPTAPRSARRGVADGHGGHDVHERRRCPGCTGRWRRRDPVRCIGSQTGRR